MMSIWNSSPRRELATNPLSGKLGADHFLSQEHGHARPTCSRALRILEDEGLLTRIPGLGYYVNHS